MNKFPEGSSAREVFEFLLTSMPGNDHNTRLENLKNAINSMFSDGMLTIKEYWDLMGLVKELEN
jgi:hypothetical protein